MRKVRRWGRFLAVAAIVLGLAGCGPKTKDDGQPSIPEQMFQDRWPAAEVPVAHIVRRDYRIREGDQLEVIYHVRHQRNPQYRIKIQDVIVVRFPFKPELNQLEQVQSDGSLYLDLIEPVYVFGKTIGQVKKELQAEYAKYLKSPEITVSFKESNVKIKELKRAIITAPRGQSRLVPVTPDGTISLPFVVTVRAAGKTIEELHRNLNDAYTALGLDELEVTVNLQTVSPFTVYVLGEVRHPGALKTTQEVSLLQAIAQARSYIPPRAELSRVLLVRRRHLPRPSAAIINVHQLLQNRRRAEAGRIVADMGKYKYDIWLEDGDIIYVPTTEIAKRADYIDYVWTRGIRAVGGFTSSYVVGDSWDLLKPNP